MSHTGRGQWTGGEEDISEGVQSILRQYAGLEVCEQVSVARGDIGLGFLETNDINRLAFITSEEQHVKNAAFLNRALLATRSATKARQAS